MPFRFSGSLAQKFLVTCEPTGKEKCFNIIEPKRFCDRALAGFAAIRDKDDGR